MELPPDLWRSACDLITARLGLHVTERRRVDLEAALVRVAGSSAFAAVAGLLARLEKGPPDDPELLELAQCLMIGETHFFRDSDCFAALERHVLPSLIEARRASGNLQLRLWSAGCSTGEEAYSLALVIDRILPDRQDWTVTILATDANRIALEAAERGVYRPWSVRDVPAWAQGAYLHRQKDGAFRAEGKIREMITFQFLNLAAGTYPSVETNTIAMDVILCRNVLMYFTREAQQATAERLTQALGVGGWLVVAPAEASPDLFRALVPEHLPRRFCIVGARWSRRRGRRPRAGS